MIKFKVVPKNFKTPANSVGYNIDAISIGVKEFNLSTEPKVPMQFNFISGATVHTTVDVMVDKKITIDGVGDIDFVAGLLSYNTANIYQVANLLSLKNGFQLLPIEEQTDLI